MAGREKNFPKEAQMAKEMGKKEIAAFFKELGVLSF